MSLTLKNPCTVYGLADNITGEVRYIGQTTQPLHKRLIRHLWAASKHHHRHLSYWVNSVLRKGGQIEIRALKEDAVWCDDEIAYISEYKAKGAKLVNGTDGGEGTTGLCRKGQKKPEGFGAKISAAKKGIPTSPHTPESKRKISLANKGKKLSKAHRDKIGAAHKGRVVSVETRKMISDQKRGRRLPLTAEQESKRKQRAAESSAKPEVRAKRSQTMKITLSRKRMEACCGVVY